MPHLAKSWEQWIEHCCSLGSQKCVYSLCTEVDLGEVGATAAPPRGSCDIMRIPAHSELSVFCVSANSACVLAGQSEFREVLLPPSCLICPEIWILLTLLRKCYILFSRRTDVMVHHGAQKDVRLPDTTLKGPTFTCECHHDLGHTELDTRSGSGRAEPGSWHIVI